MEQTGLTSQNKAVVTVPRKKDVELGSAIAPFRLLSPSEQKFVIAIAGGSNLTDAYAYAYPNSSRKAAGEHAHRLLKRENVVLSIQELRTFKQKKIDISKDAMSQRIMLLFGQMQAGGMTSKHFDVATKLFDMLNRMYGNYNEDKSHQAQIPVQINIVPVPSRSLPQENAEDVSFEVLPPEEDLGNAQKNIEDFLKD